VATILLVDDDSQVREMLTLVLRMEGFTVTPARNAADALRISRSMSGQIDLLISDVEMPDTDGLQLAAALRDTYPAIPVLLISGGRRHIDTLSSFSCCFLSKPLHMATFLRTVRQLASERRAHVAA